MSDTTQHALLGEGTFAKVFLSVDPDTNNDVAIKVFSNETKSLKSFQRETAAMVRINSAKNKERTCEMVDFSLAGENATITMKKYDIDLFSFAFPDEDTEDYPSLPIRTAITIFRNTCKSLQVLHKIGIAHLDVKPENILMNHGSLNTYLCDFGSAFISDPNNLKKPIGQRGTKSYMAPEVLIANCNYDPFKADIFSLGIVLYVLIQGNFPWFNNDGELQILPNLKPCSDSLLNLLKKMLSPKPRERPTLEEIISHRCVAPNICTRIKHKFQNHVNK